MPSLNRPNADGLRDSVSHPLTAQPAVEEVQAGLWLIQRDHMTSSVKPHEGEITIVLDFANLSAIAAELQILECHLVVSLLPRPFEGLSQSFIP